MSEASSTLDVTLRQQRAASSKGRASESSALSFAFKPMLAKVISKSLPEHHRCSRLSMSYSDTTTNSQRFSHFKETNHSMVGKHEKSFIVFRPNIVPVVFQCGRSVKGCEFQLSQKMQKLLPFEYPFVTSITPNSK